MSLRIRNQLCVGRRIDDATAVDVEILSAAALAAVRPAVAPPFQVFVTVCRSAAVTRQARGRRATVTAEAAWCMFITVGPMKKL